MNEPQEAILIEVHATPEEIQEKVKELRQIESNIQDKLITLELPSGPALINGQWV